MALIPLRGRGGVLQGHAIVDAEDFASLMRYRWFLNNCGYAVRTPRSVLMHREILGLERGNPLTGDHINRDRLDNRRENLRAITKAQNLQNRALESHLPTSTSGIRGVWWEARRKRWNAECWIDDKKHWLGRFVSKQDAADAISTFRREHMPFSAADRP